MTRLNRISLVVLLVGLVSGCKCGEPGGGGTDGGGTVGAAPVVTITAPDDGATFAAGASIDFAGSATDAEDGALTGNALAWSSSIDGQIGLGATVTTALTSEGAHTIRLTATDSDGNSASASVSITVGPQTNPIVTIVEPADGLQVAIGESITFTADVMPATGAVVDNAGIVWVSDVDGQIGIGRTIRTGLASAGGHVITVTATDDGGRRGTDSVTVTVVDNFVPDVTINVPGDGEFFLPSDSIVFDGSAVDVEDGVLTGTALVWTSDLTGQLGIGAQITTALPLGTHVVTLSATDSQGAVGAASITLQIVDNIPPQCVIQNPGNAEQFVEGTSIDFQAACTDTETGPIATGHVWTSDLDGQFGLGANVLTALPSTGTHVITVCVPDPTDATILGCDSISIEIIANTAPTCRIDVPTPGAVLPAGTPVTLDGTVTDAEDPALTGQNPQATWTSDRSGQLSGNDVATVTFPAAAAGAHVLTFRGTDSGGLTCTATVNVVVNQPPVASIDSVTQNGLPTQPFSPASPIDFTGSGSDPDGDGFVLDWVDSHAGAFGTGTGAALAAPLVGRHTVLLTATDDWGFTGSDMTTFTVLAAGQTQLVDPYTALDATLLAAGSLSVRAMAVDSTDAVLAGNQSRDVVAFDGTDPADAGAQVLGPGDLPDNATDVLFDEAAGLVYVTTENGLVVCGYTTAAGVDAASCNSYQGGDIPDNDTRAVALVTGTDGTVYLLVGTVAGLFIADTNTGSNTGNTDLGGRDIRGIAGGSGVAWIATDGDGLVRFDPVTGNDTNWDAGDGAPSDILRAVATSTAGDLVWVASDDGIGRYDPAADVWSVWRVGDAPAPGLVSNNARALAVQRVTIAGTPRDVVWVATAAGVSRFDATIPSFMTLTTADGLPSNSVRSIALLSDGTKLFGTDQGVARYTGP